MNININKNTINRTKNKMIKERALWKKKILMFKISSIENIVNVIRLYIVRSKSIFFSKMRHDDNYDQKQFSYVLWFIRNIWFFWFEFFFDLRWNNHRLTQYCQIFFFTKNIFIFIQTIQLKFRKKNRNCNRYFWKWKKRRQALYLM